MAIALPQHIWFVRSNGGSGSYPIRPEGWAVVRKFLLGMFGWGIAAATLAFVGLTWGPMWVTWTAIPFFVVGAALSAWYFIDTARRHTAYDITYDDYVKDQRAGS